MMIFGEAPPPGRIFFDTLLALSEHFLDIRGGPTTAATTAGAATAPGALSIIATTRLIRPRHQLVFPKFTAFMLSQTVRYN
jgi:hypothetical protein